MPSSSDQATPGEHRETSGAFDALRSALLWLASLSLLVVLGSVYIVATFFRPASRLDGFARFIARAVLRAAGQRLTISGDIPSPSDRSVLYVFNHASILDAMLVVAVIPEHFAAVGKAEQFRVPFWGALIRRFGLVPLERQRLDQAIHSLDVLGECLGRGTSLMISPEGTRSRDGALLPFKKGPFHVALRHRVPLVPIVFEGAWESKHLDSWLLRPGHIRATFLPAVTPQDGETVDSLRERTRQAFLGAGCR